jgi:transcriptional regulator with XRE-family HTH domain
VTACEIDPTAKPILQRMDKEEADFADRLRQLLEEKDITQQELAEKLGIGQSAISMMLGRSCRPQRKTVSRIAEALGVSSEALWPTK